MSRSIRVATRKGLFTVSDGTGRWHVESAAFLGDNVSMVLGEAGRDDVYAALDHGHFGVKLHRSLDAGKDWQEIPAPKYPPMPEGIAPDINPMSGKPIPWNLELIWALEYGHGNGELWCGTIPGALFRSRDRGDSWEIVESLWNHPLRGKWVGGGMELPGIHSICLDPRKPNRVLLGVSCGGVWVTEDDGATWRVSAKGMRAAYMPPELAYEENAQDPHRLAMCPSRPDRLWVQHHNGIFRSDDGSRSWVELENVKPSSFGFGVVVHPKDGDTAWFVPGISDQHRIPPDGRVVVTRTEDGGKTFATLTRGLPQEHAYDLVLRHALALDETGARLAMGSTTGSLWVSEDGGDSWQHVSAHLPPVYAVRWA